MMYLQLHQALLTVINLLVHVAKDTKRTRIIERELLRKTNSNKPYPQDKLPFLSQVSSPIKYTERFLLY